MEIVRSEYDRMKGAIENALMAVQVQQVFPPAIGAWWTRVHARHTEAAEPVQRALLPFELIWAYWLEEGGLLATLDAIAARFQNKARGSVGPLARMDISPLRDAADDLYAWVDDHYRRTTARRRSLEYSYEYGLRLEARTTQPPRPAENRSRFLQSFHTLLNTTMRYYREVDDRTIREDAFPVLAALRDLHLVLAEGAHNQFGNLTIQTRVELIVAQQLLARPEFRRFLGGSAMIPYPQPWMDRVDTMRRTMRWGDASIVEFWNLATCGELLLLTVRYGPFHPAQADIDLAAGWAEAQRNTITTYVHSYRVVTGVDLSSDMVNGQSVDATPPSVYLRAREARLKAASGL